MVEMINDELIQNRKLRKPMEKRVNECYAREMKFYVENKYCHHKCSQNHFNGMG